MTAICRATSASTHAEDSSSWVRVDSSVAAAARRTSTWLRAWSARSSDIADCS